MMHPEISNPNATWPNSQDDGLRRIFSANLRCILSQRGLRLDWVADTAGVSRAQLYNVLAGRSSPSLDWIQRVAQAIGVAPYVLLAPMRPNAVMGPL